MPPEDINKHTYRVMFPEEAILLNQEILNNHPILAADLAKRPNEPLQEKIALIALYCGIGVDGWFNENDLKSLVKLLLERLRKKSTIVVR